MPLIKSFFLSLCIACVAAGCTALMHPGPIVQTNEQLLDALSKALNEGRTGDAKFYSQTIGYILPIPKDLEISSYKSENHIIEMTEGQFEGKTINVRTWYDRPTDTLHLTMRFPIPACIHQLEAQQSFKGHLFESVLNRTVPAHGDSSPIWPAQYKTARRFGASVQGVIITSKDRESCVKDILAYQIYYRGNEK